MQEPKPSTKQMVALGIGVAGLLIYSVFVPFDNSRYAKIIPMANRVPNAKAPQSNKPMSSESKTTLISDFRSRLDKVAECYSHDNCPYSNSDPRAYALAVGQDLKRNLDRFAQKVLSEGFRDLEIERIASEYLAVPDGHVKEAALELLQTQGPSELGVEAVLQQVFTYHDAKLIPMGLRYLAGLASANPLTDSRISQTLSEAVRSGSPFVAREIAKNILLILNEDNFSYYESLLSELSPRSTEHRYLKAALREFSRKHQGG